MVKKNCENCLYAEWSFNEKINDWCIESCAHNINVNEECADWVDVYSKFSSGLLYDLIKKYRERKR